MAPQAKPQPSVTITLPIPARSLSPNARVHWAARSKARAQQRGSAHAHARAAMFLPERWPSASILVRWYGKTAQCLRLDADNIIGSLKGAVDGLADAGLIADDRGVTWLPPVRAVDKANPRVELVVTKTEPEKGTP